MNNKSLFSVIICLTIFIILSASSQSLCEVKSTRQVKDMSGRVVNLPLEIKSIGTIGAVGVLNAFIEVMGEGSKIQNRLPGSFASSGRWNFQYQFAPQIETGPLFEGPGRELLIENIIMAKPDVILAMSKELCGQFEIIGIPCVYLEWKDINDVKIAVDLMGQIFNKPDRAKQYLSYFNQKLVLAQTLTKDLSEKDKPRVLYGNPLQFSQPHQIAEWWISQAGGVSVTGQSMIKGSLKYNLEDLLRWDPEVIILLNHKDISYLKTNESFKNISAIKNNKFNFIPTVAHTWGNRTVEQPLTVLWALHKLHPKLLSFDNLADEIRHFYSFFFQYQLSAEQINAIIEGATLD